MGTWRSAPIGMLVILWLAGWTLRVPILSAPPLATQIASSFGLGETGIGALTMLPLVSVAFGALPAAWLIARFGLRVTISGGIALMAIASMARGYMPGTSMLMLMSILMGFAVAAFQTALPAAVTRWTPSHIAIGSAVYLNGMMVGEFSGAGLTLPLVLPLAGGDWRLALIYWAIPIALISLVIWFATASNAQGTDDTKSGSTKFASLPRWNDMQMWQFGLMLASSIVVFFAINAYAGTVLQSRGEEDVLAGFLMAYNVTPLIASFIVVSSPGWIGKRNPLAFFTIMAALGFGGFVFFDGWVSWIAAVIAGLTSTIQLILLVSLPAAIAKGLGVTRLSAGTTLVGYAIAFVLPLIGGWLAEKGGETELALLPALIFALAMIPALGRDKRYTCKSASTY